MILRIITLFITVVFFVVACAKKLDIQGVWFFNYERTKFDTFPNTFYDSARDLIADVEPRYGTVQVDGNTIVLGGAVCKVTQINSDNGLECNEQGQTSTLGIHVKDEQLVIKSGKSPEITMIFSRKKQDPFAVYGVDPTAKPYEEFTNVSDEAVATPESEVKNLRGYAKTASFNAFYDPESVKEDGRLTSVMIVLNYLEAKFEGSSATPSLSSVQRLTFDCPASNYRIDQFYMYSGSDGNGAQVSDSGASEITPEWKPVPENSINKILYMKVCRRHQP